MSENDPQETEFLASAKELIERHGNEAIAYMHDRIANLSEGGADGDLNHAYRLLTTVERLLEKEA